MSLPYIPESLRERLLEHKKHYFSFDVDRFCKWYVSKPLSWQIEHTDDDIVLLNKIRGGEQYPQSKWKPWEPYPEFVILKTRENNFIVHRAGRSFFVNRGVRKGIWYWGETKNKVVKGRTPTKTKALMIIKTLFDPPTEPREPPPIIIQTELSL